MPNMEVPPPGYLRLNEARDLIPPELVERMRPEDRPKAARSKNAAPALLLRRAILAGAVKVSVRRPDGGLEAIDLTEFASLPQPADGTVFTFLYLRSGTRWQRIVPKRMWAWLPEAELLIDETSFKRWLRKQQPARNPRGRPARVDAREKAEALVAEGTWNPASGTPGQLDYLLNAPGVLTKSVTLSTVSRIAQELGYRPRRARAL